MSARELALDFAKRNLHLSDTLRKVTAALDWALGETRRPLRCDDDIDAVLEWTSAHREAQAALADARRAVSWSND